MPTHTGYPQFSYSHRLPHSKLKALQRKTERSAHRDTGIPPQQSEVKKLQEKKKRKCEEKKKQLSAMAKYRNQSLITWPLRRWGIRGVRGRESSCPRPTSLSISLSYLPPPALTLLAIAWNFVLYLGALLSNYGFKFCVEHSTA